MPRRGLSEVECVVIGAVNMTAATGALPAGHADARPLNGSWVNADQRDENPGVTRISGRGHIKTIFYPPPEPGGLWNVELRFTRYDPIAHFQALQDELATGAKVDIVIPLLDGRTFVGKAKADRTDPKRSPVSESSGDHEHYGGQGRELIVLLITTEGAFE